MYSSIGVKMKIKVISLDVTAIIPPNNFTLNDNDSYERIRTHNWPLLGNLLKDEQNYDQHIVMVPNDSNSQRLEIVTTFTTCYQKGLREPKKCLQVEYEPVNVSSQDIEKLKFFLYEQMHQIAKTYPESELTFELCYGEEKNQELFSYFQESSRLVPDNVAIKNPTEAALDTCQGKGLINPIFGKKEHAGDLISIINERDALPDSLGEKLKSFENCLLQISDKKLKYITRNIAMIAQEKWMKLANNPEFNKFLDNALRVINLQVNEQQRVHFNTLLEQSMLIFKQVGYGTKRQRFFNDEERTLHLNWLLYANQLLEGTLSCFEEGGLSKIDQVHDALGKLNNYKNHQYLVAACAFIIGGLLTLTPAVSVILLHLAFNSALLAVSSLIVGVPVYFAGLITLGQSSAAFEIAKGQSDVVSPLKDAVEFFDNELKDFEANNLAFLK